MIDTQAFLFIYFAATLLNSIDYIWTNLLKHSVQTSELGNTVLSLAIKVPPHAQSDKINDSTHRGEFKSLGGHKMLRERWGCKVKKKIYIEKATWTHQRGAVVS